MRYPRVTNIEEALKVSGDVLQDCVNKKAFSELKYNTEKQQIEMDTSSGSPKKIEVFEGVVGGELRRFRLSEFSGDTVTISIGKPPE
jgi:hypothetical protein